MRVFEIIITVMAVILGLSIAFTILMNGGTITINKSYEKEYQTCQANLEQAQKSVQCPEVKVNCGATGIVYIIWATVFWLAGACFYWYSLNRVDKND